MILDWLLRHHQKEAEKMSLDEQQQEQQPEQKVDAQQAQPVVDGPTIAEPKAEEAQDEQQSKMADALGALTVEKGQLAVASDGRMWLSSPGSLALTAPDALKIEAPIHAPGAPYPVSDSLYSYASLATKSAVDKLEAAFQERIFHMRTLLNHLGQEAEAEVMALFEKHPIAVD